MPIVSKLFFGNTSTYTNTNTVTLDNSYYWRKWNNSDTTGSTWQRWNDDWVLSSDTGTTDAQIWTIWNDRWERQHVFPMPQEERDRVQGAIDHWASQGRVVHLGASSEQREQWRREEEERERKTREAAKQWEEACARAEILLKSCLTPQQQEELEKRNYFHIEVQGKRYRIRRGRSRNVHEVNAQDQVIKTLCAHPYERVPDADTMLVQKLMLESAEADFLRIANHS